MNVTRNHRRSARRHQAALGQLAAARPQLSRDQTSDRTMHALLEDLARLPRGERDVVGLCLWSGLSNQEAATALGIPIGTVKSRLSRARKHLAELHCGVQQIAPPAPRSHGATP